MSSSTRQFCFTLFVWCKWPQTKSQAALRCCEPDRCVYNTLPSRFHTLQGARSHLTSLASTPTHMWTHIQTTSSPCFCLNQQQPYPDCPCQLFKVKFKGMVHPKIQMYSSSGHPVCRWDCFFIGTDLEQFSITLLAHQWILCSEWVPDCWYTSQ